MTTRLFARLGPACGLLSSVSLFVLPQHHLKPLHLAAFVLFLPFLAYLCNLLRGTSEEAGWLAQTAFATGVAGITLKLASITPEIAINRYQIAAGTTLHSGLQGIADAATEVALFPLGFMLVALAVVAVRSRLLPRALGYSAFLIGIGLVVNGSYNLYSHSGFVPALLLFVLWTLVTSAVLLRRAWVEPAGIGQASPAAAG